MPFPLAADCPEFETSVLRVVLLYFCTMSTRTHDGMTSRLLRGIFRGEHRSRVVFVSDHGKVIECSSATCSHYHSLYRSDVRTKVCEYQQHSTCRR
jgi:hypothetical protein